MNKKLDIIEHTKDDQISEFDKLLQKEFKPNTQYTLSEDELRKLYGVPRIQFKPNKYAGYCKVCNSWCHVNDGYWKPSGIGLVHKICPTNRTTRTVGYFKPKEW